MSSEKEQPQSKEQITDKDSGSSTTHLLSIATELRQKIEEKCDSIEKNVLAYKSFTLPKRPDLNLSDIHETISKLRGAQDYVSSCRLDIISYQRVAKRKIDKYKEILKSAETSVRAEVEESHKGKRVAKAIKDEEVRKRVDEFSILLRELDIIYARTKECEDIVKEVDSNLRDAGIQLCNQISVLDKQARIGELKPGSQVPSVQSPVETSNGKVSL